MLKSSARSAIRLRGVRHNNLKNFDLDLPLNQLIVITGLSGSGKSSLAFDTLFAEGQRRYIETFSPYARQFFDRMDKPQVDSIEGIPARHRHRAAQCRQDHPFHGRHDDRDLRLHEDALAACRATALPPVRPARAQRFAAADLE